MEIIKQSHNPNIASVYIAKTKDNNFVEFVESIQPPLPREKKWVIILSSLAGCPIKCKFCEAGGNYKRILTFEELIFQIKYILKKNNIASPFNIKTEKFKIQFARIGEPSFNDNVLTLLRELPCLINAPGILPCISTIAPANKPRFFDELLQIKKELYRYNFQLQFSVHSTDENYRDYLLPYPKWKLREISDYADKFFDKDGRKITLNFAPSIETPICPNTIREYFDPEKYLIKFTPVNPTQKAVENNLSSMIIPDQTEYPIIKELNEHGFDTIISIGELEENKIGSNCGQYITNYNRTSKELKDAYTYPLEHIREKSSER